MKLRILCALACTIVGCGGDSPTSPSEVAGVWALQTINGQALPFSEPNQSFPIAKSEILNDVITFAPGGTYASTGQSRLTLTNGQIQTTTATDQGTWAVNLKQLSLLSTKTNATGIATLVGNTLTVVGQYTFVFRKQ